MQYMAHNGVERTRRANHTMTGKSFNDVELRVRQHGYLHLTSCELWTSRCKEATMDCQVRQQLSCIRTGK
eukprot:6205982-Pleurochrysis_carterae.AAC.1